MVAGSYRRSGAGLVAQAGVAGPHDRLGPVGDLEFDQDVGDVVADGFLAEVQPGGDGGVGPALGDQFQHFAFPAGQLREDRWCRWSVAREEGQYAGGEPGAEDCLPGGGRVYGAPGELLRTCVNAPEGPIEIDL